MSGSGNSSRTLLWTNQEQVTFPIDDKWPSRTTRNKWDLHIVERSFSSCTDDAWMNDTTRFQVFRVLKICSSDSCPQSCCLVRLVNIESFQLADFLAFKTI